MPQTPAEIHMYDMVKIDTIVFEIVGGGAFKDLPPTARIGLNHIYNYQEYGKNMNISEGNIVIHNSFQSQQG